MCVNVIAKKSDSAALRVVVEAAKKFSNILSVFRNQFNCCPSVEITVHESVIDDATWEEEIEKKIIEQFPFPGWSGIESVPDKLRKLATSPLKKRPKCINLMIGSSQIGGLTGSVGGIATLGPERNTTWGFGIINPKGLGTNAGADGVLVGHEMGHALGLEDLKSPYSSGWNLMGYGAGTRLTRGQCRKIKDFLKFYPGF